MEALAAESFGGGFAEPVIEAQQAFRALMDAMARPGTIMPIAAAVNPPAPLSAVAGAVALTLCDQDTPVWLDPALDGAGGVAGWLGFHTGAAVTRTPALAHFAFFARAAEAIALENFSQGSQEYPDRSTTLVLQVDTLADGDPLRLTGPGIAETAQLAPAPLPRHFAEQWRQNQARFPRGIDVILAAPAGVACLPRTVRIEPAGRR